MLSSYLQNGAAAKNKCYFSTTSPSPTTGLPIRLFDLTTQDGSLERRSYVITEKNQFCLSTTGANIFGQKGMGTPKILVVSVQNLEDPEAINLRTVCQANLEMS